MPELPHYSLPRQRRVSSTNEFGEVVPGLSNIHIQEYLLD